MMIIVKKKKKSQEVFVENHRNVALEIHRETFID